MSVFFCYGLDKYILIILDIENRWVVHIIRVS